jgi:hypothetical protein
MSEKNLYIRIYFLVLSRLTNDMHNCNIILLQNTWIELTLNTLYNLNTDVH